VKSPGSPEDFEDAATAVQPGRAAKTGSSRESAYVLVVVEGPDEGARVPVDDAQPTPILIGQGPACALRLADRQVSRRHAAIELDNGRARLRDLGSTNGTFIEGISVLDAYVAPGEIIRMGSTQLRLEREAPKKDQIPRASAFGRVLGASHEMRRLYPVLERFAHSTVPVVLEGETGTGKEAVAEAIHEAGDRAHGPYVVFDCTAVPANLLESELFGHERGAFTGAVAARKGVFEQAHGGTLLIDEIGDLDLALQPKLLRALERSEVRRVGGDKPLRVDVRVLAATRRDLDHEVQEGRFRDDLFHRLAVGRVELPPLRKRKGDIPVLAAYFWRTLGGGDKPIPADLLRRWEDDPWPGNVRELRNAVARHITVGDLSLEESMEDAPSAGPTSASNIDDAIGRILTERLPLPIARLRVIEELEKRYIERVLAENGGSIQRAAAASGIGRRYFQILRGKQRK
jgi:transcriptional regulator with GAF, ATPase, and Fis domain